jgi:hypothetical protein
MPITGLLETRCDTLFEKLVPSEGKASTVEGEMIRAICRITYRYRNDGDYFYDGPGCSTAGPSHAFLTSRSHCPIAIRLEQLLNRAVNKTDDDYEDALAPVIEAVVNYVEDRKGEYTPNNVDSLDCRSHYIEDTEDDYEDEDEF